MKKFLLSAFFLGSLFTAKAQTVIFSEDFNANPPALPSGWTLTDGDGDGQNWSVAQITDTAGNPAANYPTPCLRSASWNQTPLTPNNWIFSPVIDLSTYAGKKIMLKWKVSAADADFDAEKYSVYVSNTNTTAGMLASSTSFTENTLDGVNSFAQRTLDITAFAGQASVYLAFRHYDTSDEFTMEIDDIEVEDQGNASNETFFADNFNMYPNPATDVLNISSNNGSEIKEIKITDLTGKKIKSLSNVTSINVSDLASGTYIIDVKTNEGNGTSKFIKK